MLMLGEDLTLATRHVSSSVSLGDTDTNYTWAAAASRPSGPISRHFLAQFPVFICCPSIRSW